MMHVSWSREVIGVLLQPRLFLQGGGSSMGTSRRTIGLLNGAMGKWVMSCLAFARSN